MFCFVLVSLFMISFVSAENEDVIMRLSSYENAHAGLWNSTYSYILNYTEIFGSVYFGDSTQVHNCSVNSPFLWLSKETNSHVSNVSNSVYNVPVCYGDLVCSVLTGDCPGVVIARLSDFTNAHISNASDDDYPVKICCGGVGGGDLYWADANGVPIGQSDNVNIGDTVRAVAGVSSIGTFNILEHNNDDGSSDDIRTDVEGELDANNNLVYRWKITQDDLNKTDEDFDAFYFRTNLTGEDESNNISIDGTYDDFPMNITIVSPDCGDDFDEGKNVTIEVVADDEDDVIEGNVTIVTIDDVFVRSFTNGGVVFNYTFALPGNFQIVAEGINSRGKRARHIANIMILDKEDGSYVAGEYTAACISSPKDFSNMKSSKVKFNASTTRAIKVVGGAPLVLTPKNNATSFSWYWGFASSDNTWSVAWEYVKKIDVKAYEFWVDFPVAGDNSASLRVELS